MSPASSCFSFNAEDVTSFYLYNNQLLPAKQIMKKESGCQKGGTSLQPIALEFNFSTFTIRSSQGPALIPRF